MKYQRLTIILAAVLWSVACGETNKNQSPLIEMVSDQAVTWTSQAALTSATSCGDAEASFKAMLTSSMIMQLEQQRKYYIDYQSSNSKYGGELDAGAAEPAAENSSSSDSQSAEEYSDTNVQVEGVDEADLVKTDGNMIYTVTEKDLVLVDAWPPQQMHETARLEIKGSPYSLYRYDDKLVVLSNSNLTELSTPQENDESKNGNDYYSYYWQPMVIVTVVDASDSANPVMESETAFDGNTVSTRRIGRHLYLVQRNHMYDITNQLEYWPNIEWGSEVEVINDAFIKLATKNLALINGLTLEDFQSFSYSFGKDGYIKKDTASPLTECASVYTPNVYSGFGTITTVTMDLDEQAATTGSSVIGNWGTVYASLDSLYVASTNWSWWWWWGEDGDRPEIVTHLHKFSFDADNGTAVYQASGSVPGYVLNQFSMDEFDSHLRVATTLPDWWWWGNEEENQSESYVTILRQDNGKLNQVGQVAGLGLGEQIFSVRFIKEKGYVVTFRQVDPLYVLDLSNANDPKVTGELKVPGFSSYMHPIDDNHLLTVGRDATEDGQVLGLQFQIFDVTDPADPRQIAKTVMNEDKWGWMWSEAQWDHHAFVYFASRGLLAIPVSGYHYEESEEGWYSSGTYYSQLELFQVSIEDGVQSLGAVTHMDMLGELPQPDQDYCYGSFGWWYNYKTRIRRGIFMDDYLFSLSAAGLKVNLTTDLEAGPVAHVQLIDVEELLADFLNYYSYCWGDW